MDAFLKLFDAFIDIIVGKVYDRINERILKVENDVKTLHDAGSALLSLNLDDGFKAKMSDFVQNEVDLWYENQGPEALWSEREIDARIDMALDNAGFSKDSIEETAAQAAAERVADEVRDAIREHERDKEHFDYREEFDSAVDERIDEQIRPSGSIGKALTALGEALGKSPADVVPRSQLKALLIAAAGMVDSIDAPKAQEGGK